MPARPQSWSTRPAPIPAGPARARRPTPRPGNSETSTAATAAPESGIASDADAKPRTVTAKRPNHVWHIDLTAVPTSVGFWCSWTPCSVLQSWPFCWWTAVIVDHDSRRIMGTATFSKQPTSEQVRGALGRAIRKADVAPKYIICDKGSQFDNEGFRDWCRRRGVRPPRYGAVGKRGSIAVVERAILTIKTLLATLAIISLNRRQFHRELDLLVGWYNDHRPHTTLGGRTPNEHYFDRRPANRQPRFEPRQRWPRGSPSASPAALVKGKPGVELDLHVTYHGGRKHLPVVALKKRAA